MSWTRFAVVLAGVGLTQGALADGEDRQSGSATRCYASHFVRLSGAEMRFSVLTFSNGDLANPAVIERITVRSDTGVVLHDSGPRTPDAHPLARGVNPPRDITVVPPGGSFTLSTSDIWAFNPVPGFENAGAMVMNVHVEVSKRGKRRLFEVSSREIVRDRVLLPTGPTVGAEKAANSAPCFPVEQQN